MSNNSSGDAHAAVPASTSGSVILDKAAVAKGAADMSDSLRAAFDKHHELVKSHRELEGENEHLRHEIAKVNAEAKSNQHAKAELVETRYELKKSKAMVAKLSTEVQKLRKDVDKWFQKSLKRETPIIPMLNAKGEPVENTITPRTSIDPKPEITPRISTSSSTSDSSSPAKKRKRVVELVLNSDGEFEEEEQPQTPKSDASKDGGQPTVKKEESIVLVAEPRKRSRSPKSPSPATPHSMEKNMPLQTNTCKVCQEYWRAEDARTPGQMKTRDLPYCRIHGKKRPPNTPENFWKVRLTPPPADR